MLTSHEEYPAHPEASGDGDTGLTFPDNDNDPATDSGDGSNDQFWDPVQGD